MTLDEIKIAVQAHASAEAAAYNAQKPHGLDAKATLDYFNMVSPKISKSIAEFLTHCLTETTVTSIEEMQSITDTAKAAYNAAMASLYNAFFPAN